MGGCRGSIQGISAGLKALLDDILDDASERKLVSHLKLKARAIQGADSFHGLSKAQLQFLFCLYALSFPKSKKKKFLCESLVECICETNFMPASHLATWGMYNKVIKDFKVRGETADFTETRQADNDTPALIEGINDISVDRFEELSSLGIPTEETDLQHSSTGNFVEVASNISHDKENVAVPAPTTIQRRKRFNPIARQRQRLVTEFVRNDGQVPNAVSFALANEFSVDISQIFRWFTNYKKRNQALIS